MIENNIINLINELTSRYQLPPNIVQEITIKYQNDQRSIDLVRKDIEKACNFYTTQTKLNNIISTTPPLQPGKNYYVTTFDTTSNLYLCPVSITVTNPEKSEVLV